MKTDNRKLSQEVQKEKRKIALRMREKGYSHEQISEVLDVHKNTVGNWISKSNKKRIEAVISGGKKGAIIGQSRTLNKEQEEEIRSLICVSLPENLGLTDSLWTRKAVKGLIKKRYAYEMPVRTVGDYLKRWGFTPQKPLKKAYEQNQANIEKWVKEDYPAIKSKALNENGEINWVDEMGVRNECQHGRSYSPIGKTPVKLVSGKRFKVNMISSITNQGKLRYMIDDDKFTGYVFIKFMNQLIKGSEKKIFLIVDNLRAHKSKVVLEWLAQKKEKIEVYYLPTYSPELNPDEYLNCDLKALFQSKTSPKSKTELKSKLRSSLKIIQLDKERIKKYFKHPLIKYAA